MFVSKEHILKIDLEVLFMKVQKRVISNLNKCYAMSRHSFRKLWLLH